MSNTKKVFRFNFDVETRELLESFCKLHVNEKREDYKNSWDLWVRDNLDTIEKETIRLNELGYDGDVETKMFKAARYYFGKKRSKLNKSNTYDDNDRETCSYSKRNYICVTHELIIAMDHHIKKYVLNSDKSPADGYNNFENNNPLLIAAEINNILLIDDSLDKHFISKKIKKTYKNRYYISKTQ